MYRHVLIYAPFSIIWVLLSSIKSWIWMLPSKAAIWWRLRGNKKITWHSGLGIKVCQKIRKNKKKRNQFPLEWGTEVSDKNNITAALCPQERPAYVTVCLLHPWISVCGQLGSMQTSELISCLCIFLSEAFLCVYACSVPARSWPASALLSVSGGLWEEGHVVASKIMSRSQMHCVGPALITAPFSTIPGAQT